MDLPAAIAFITANGSDLERARLQHILYGQPVERTVLSSLLDLQAGDGGFPFRWTKGHPSSVNQTTAALWQLDELGMLLSPAAGRASQYLLAVQREDGSWDEHPDVARHDPPPWARPGDLPARLYLSANAAYWLAVLGHTHSPPLQQALDFLRQHQDKRGRFSGFLHTSWIACGVFALAGPRYTAIVNKGLQSLQDYPLAKWVDSQLAWALDVLARAGLPQDAPFVQQALPDLLRRQAANGSWASEDGPAFAAGATIQALKVFNHYDLLPMED